MVVIADRRMADAIAIEACLRVRARKAAGPTEEEQAWRVEELERCAADILYWIDQYCWTFDPRLPAGEQELPFHLYDYQRRYILWLEERYQAHQDGLTEKSRDVGVTWCCLGWMAHHWRFDGAFQALLGSRKEDLVDNSDDPDSLFWRLEFIVNHLPEWMLPAEYDKDKHRRFLKLLNPESGAGLFGAASSRGFGRQGRRNVVYLDEFAFWPDSKAVWSGTADTSPCRLVVSTPNPYEASGLDFEHLRDSDKVQVYTVHWRQHPLKDEAWLENERTRRTDEEIAVELEISYQVAISGRVYPEWDKVPHGEFPYQQGWPLFCSWDYGLDDDTALIWAQRNPATQKFRIIDCYHNSQRTIDFYVPWSTGQVTSGLPYGYSEADLAQIAQRQGWPGATHFGDPAGHQRNQVSGTSVIKSLSLASIHVNTKAGTNTFEARHRETQMFLRQVEGINMPACQALDDAMRHARYPKRSEGGQETGERNKPVHDWTCLAGETEIRTLDGWAPIRELVGEENFWIWAYSLTERRLVPAVASKCSRTYHDAPLVEVGLDNGMSIRATADHLFMCRDTSWIDCGHLAVGESLMPFYEYNEEGYVGVHLNDGSKAAEHKYVYARCCGPLPPDSHIHHEDGCKTHNNPENLEAVSHVAHCGITFRGKSMTERRAMTTDPYLTKYSQAAILRNCLKCGTEFWGNYKTFYCSRSCVREANACRHTRPNRYERDPNYVTIAQKASRAFEDSHKHKCIECEAMVSRRAVRCEVHEYATRNHKVRFVRPTSSDEVFDIEVPQYHNFVAGGVVVHNSHLRSATEYLAVNVPRVGAKPQKQQRRKSSWESM